MLRIKQKRTRRGLPTSSGSVGGRQGYLGTERVHGLFEISVAVPSDDVARREGGVRWREGFRSHVGENQIQGGGQGIDGQSGFVSVAFSLRFCPMR